MAVTFDEAAASRRVFQAVPRQVALAKKLGITSSAISNLKRRRRCTLALVVAASELTGKPVAWFLFGDRDEKKSPGEPAKPTASGIAETRRRSAELAEMLAVAEGLSDYGQARGLPELLQLYGERLAALEDRVRALELRLAALDQHSA